MTDWKSSVLPKVHHECLNCIKLVETTRKHEPRAVAGDCINHNWPQETISRSRTCGEYSIYEDYYELCSRAYLRSKDEVTPMSPPSLEFEECALNSSCSRMCVRAYLKAPAQIKTSCGRAEHRDRMCVDYGIIHAFGPEACLLKQNNDGDVLSYVEWMKESCGVKDPAPGQTQKSTTTSTPSTINHLAIILPIVIVTAILLVVIAGVLWFIVRKKRAELKLRQAIPMNERVVNGYGGPPVSHGGGMLNIAGLYSIGECSDEIKEVVKTNLISITNVEVMEEIGRGQFGVIRRAKCYTNAEHTESKLAAVKIIRNLNPENSEQEIKNMLREAHIMSQFDHENVLSLMGIIWEHGEAPVVITPYMVKGSLLDIIRKSELRFSEDDLMNFVTQLASGLEYLEGMKFVHRDIALRNCLVSDLFVVKISDFGLTRDIYDSRIYECTDMSEKRLPWKWLAPECIRQGSFTHKSDVWSFGVTIWELFTNGSSPYPAIGNLSVLVECLQAGYRLAKPDKLSPKVYDLMRLMWTENPDNRPDFKEISSAIKLLTTSDNADGEYSYTMSTTGTITAKAHPEGYEVPLPSDDPPDRRQSSMSNVSSPYADKPITRLDHSD